RNVEIMNWIIYKYYLNFGLTAGFDRTGNQTVGSITLNNIPAFPWSATEYAPDTRHAWSFRFENGVVTTFFDKGVLLSAWAVHDGDIFQVVPIPGSLYLFGTGLLWLIGIARR
ncbi:MAG: hypothetical protein WBQ78_00490, partial [Gammaproteobacteria bacterium]